MLDEEKKTGKDPVTEEEKPNEPAREEPEHDEDQPSEDECDETVAELLAEINRLSIRVGELERAHAAHESEYEHIAKRVEPGPGDGPEPTPEERHFYFRRLGKH